MNDDFDETQTDVTDASATNNDLQPQWDDNSPRGGRTVLNRILKDGAKVPLFLGQTLIQSLRDLGYNHTTSAVCEHVDNALQWGATEIRVYFHQTGRRGDYKLDVLVFDNGKGMSPNVLKIATAFGGSMVYGQRAGIGRYGMGMKAAALSMSPTLDLYSWQEENAIYNMMLDVNDIGANRSNLIELSDPILIDSLPTDIVNILTQPMEYPKRSDDNQDLLAYDEQELKERLGSSGTIVYMPECDRLSAKTGKTLVDHATGEMGRVYRRFIHEDGVRIYVNNRLVEASDPTYHMARAWHTRVQGLKETRSRLVQSWQVKIQQDDESEPIGVASVRLFALPYEEWSRFPRKVQKNDLRLFDGHLVSYLRNRREVKSGADGRLKITGHHTNTWLRLEVEFPGELDEAFGVAANKQGVRPKDYVYECIVAAIWDDLKAIRADIARKKAEIATPRTGAQLSEAERRATDAEIIQSRPLPGARPDTDEERAVQEQNLRSLAFALKRDDESEEQAFERLKSSDYVVTFKHDEYWPFYHCDCRYGKVILTINTAHPFFEKLWQPLSDLSKMTAGSIESTELDDDEMSIDRNVADRCSEALVALQLLLMSLARAQGQMAASGDELQRDVFETLRREWSANLKAQLNSR